MSRKSAYSKYFPLAPLWCWDLRCSQDRSTEHPSCCRRKAMSRRRLWRRSKTRVPAVLTTRQAWLPGSNLEQRVPTLKIAKTLVMALNPPRPTPATTPPADSTTVPIEEVENPTSTAPAVFISAAFPTTPATPTLPFASTARTRWARRRSRSTSMHVPPKRAALRNSPSSTALAALARCSPA